MRRLLLTILYGTTLITSLAQPIDLVVQTGHSSSVFGVAFSPDGKYIASTCNDGSVKIWDTKLGFEISTFYNYETYGYDVAFSHDGKYLLGTGVNLNVIWNVATGKPIATIASGDGEEFEEGGALTKGIFSYNNKYCYGSREDFSIMRWDMEEITHPTKYSYKYDRIPFSEDSILNLSPPSSAFFYKGHTAEITGLAITKDNKYLVSCSDDSTIIIWNAQTGEKIRTIKNSFKLENIALTPDGKKIISCDDDMSEKEGLQIWDLQTGKQLFYKHTQYDKIKCLAVSPDGKYLAYGKLRGSLDIFSLASNKVITTIEAHSSWINGIAFSNDSRRLVSGSNDDNITIWDITTGKPIKEFRKTIANIDRLTYEKQHRLITTSSSTIKKQTTVTWELDQGIGIKNVFITKPQIRSDEFLSMDSAGKQLLITHDSALMIFDPVSGKEIQTTPLPFWGSAIMAPGGEYVFFQNRKTDSFYILKKGFTVPELFAPHPDSDTNTYHRSVGAIDFSKDGKLVAAGGAGPDIYIWNRDTKQYLRNLNYLDADSSERKKGTYHEDEYLALPNSKIYCLKFSPDGKHLAAGVHFPDPIAYGGLVIVWDVATGKMLHWEIAHIYPVQSINWSPDGKYLITGGNDKFVKIWAYEDFEKSYPEPVYSYQHDFTSMHTSFTDDNKWIISAGIDGKIIIKDAVDYTTIATLIGLDATDYVAITKDQYYAASKKGTRYIAFRQGNKVFPAEQFDLKYNRPDKVMEALGSSDTALIRSYKNAYNKRVKKLGLDTASFREGFAVPTADFVNSDMIHYTQVNPDINLHIKAADTIWKLDRFNIWVNEVPLFGQRGLRLLNRNKIDTTIKVKLTQGENRIETSVININGAESFREPLVVNYAPAKPVKEKAVFIGIGIDKFAQSEHNLQYSAKDIRDLSIKLKEKYGSDIVIDTLFNENVTVRNVKALKQRLQQTTENHKVIVAYSGHGLLSKEYDYYLSTYAVNFEKPEENGLSYDDLENLLDSIPARKKLLLIDACHSGEVDKEDLITLNATSDSLIKGLKPVAYKKENQLGLKNSFELMQSLFVNVGKSTGATIISAAAGTQFALERNDLKNGVFTYSILEAMKQHSTMKISELKKVVGERVEHLTKGMQKPTSRNETISVDWSMW